MADGANPRDVKFELGQELVGRFHGDAAGRAARDAFIKQFRGGAVPEDMAEVALEAPDGSLGIANLLRAANLVSSNSEAFRLIGQGAVRIDGAPVEDRGLEIQAGTTHVYQVGKRRFARVRVS